MAQELRDSGYSGETVIATSPSLGTYALNAEQHHHPARPAVVPLPNRARRFRLTSGLVSKISGDGGQELDAYELEPVADHRPLRRPEPHQAAAG